MFKKILKNEKGFTLIELLAVIVILGIISAIAIPAIGNIIEKSREDAIKADAISVLEGARLAYASGDITAGTTLGTETDPTLDAFMSEYIEQVDTGRLTVTGITYDANGVPALTGTGQDGGVKLTFTTATIADINADTSGDDDPTNGTE
ncbi:type II secretion system protein [Bacillaceae bacterium S4-13-58]